MTDTTKLVTRKPPAAGKGRPKGSQNKATKALKDMILGALDDAGGQDYLRRQSIENPTAFLTLIGKVLPTTINADVKGEVGVVIRRFTPEPNGD
ncbi:MAG: hypothetical protein IM654_02045 [Phenylobacterium sp.]|jgi:hypothetical protein|nr:hypothetical protein [Phenylobacterium sp.]